MKSVHRTIFLLIILLVISSCEFVSNALTYKETTRSFVDALIEEDYEKSLTFMATENEAFQKSVNIDTLKLVLVDFKKVIVNNFGKELDYKLITASKTVSTKESESTAAKTTEAKIQFSNKVEFGVLEIRFDDISNKILHVKTLDIKRKIPSMSVFWLFGMLALCVPIFNIWIIRKIRRSNLPRKWPKYLAVMIFNFPAIVYGAVNGISLELLNIQILFGISFVYMGYLSSAWSFGIPLGGLYWLWKLRNSNLDETIKENLIVED